MLLGSIHLNVQYDTPYLTQKTEKNPMKMYLNKQTWEKVEKLYATRNNGMMKLVNFLVELIFNCFSFSKKLNSFCKDKRNVLQDKLFISNMI